MSSGNLNFMTLLCLFPFWHRLLMSYTESRHLTDSNSKQNKITLSDSGKVQEKIVNVVKPLTNYCPVGLLDDNHLIEPKCLCFLPQMHSSLLLKRFKLNSFFSDGSFLSSVTWESALPLVSSGTSPGRTLSLWVNGCTARLFYDRSKTPMNRTGLFSKVRKSKSKSADFTVHYSDVIGQKQGLRELPEDHRKLVVW